MVELRLWMLPVKSRTRLLRPKCTVFASTVRNKRTNTRAPLRAVGCDWCSNANGGLIWSWFWALNWHCLLQLPLPANVRICNGPSGWQIVAGKSARLLRNLHLSVEKRFWLSTRTVRIYFLDDRVRGMARNRKPEVVCVINAEKCRNIGCKMERVYCD